MRKSLVVLGTAALVALTAQGAAAAEPTRETVHANPQFDIGECSGCRRAPALTCTSSCQAKARWA